MTRRERRQRMREDARQVFPDRRDRRDALETIRRLPAAMQSEVLQGRGLANLSEETRAALMQSAAAVRGRKDAR